MIKLSVIVPIYNVAPYLERCVVSLMEQTLKEGIEFIFIDDCSTDKSISILREVLSHYPHRSSQVAVLQNATNLGLGAVRALGFLHAQGEYVTHCDADDWVEPDAYKAICNEIDHSHADIIVNSFFQEDESTAQTVIYPKQTIGERLVNGHWWMQWSHTVRRSLLTEHHLTTISGINFWEDMDFLMRVYHFATSISYISQPLYHYNQCNLGSLSKVNQELTLLPSCQRVIDHLSQFYMEQQTAPPIRLLALQQFTRDLYLQQPSIDWHSWQSLYPQSWHYLWHDPQYKLGYRITYTLASWGWQLPFQIYRSFSKRKLQ